MQGATVLASLLVLLLLLPFGNCDYISGQVIVKYKATGGSRSSAAPEPALLQLQPGEDVEMALKRLQSDPRVEWVEPNYLVAGTQSNSWASPGEIANWGLTKISAQTAWSMVNSTASAKVCIIDSGTDCRHPDLQKNCLDGYNVLTNKRGIQAAMDDNGHGTQVAGVVAASYGNAGIVGVAPNVGICKYQCLSEIEQIPASESDVNH